MIPTPIRDDDSLDSLTREEFDEELNNNSSNAPNNETDSSGRFGCFFVPDAIFKEQSNGEYDQLPVLEMEDAEDDTLIDLNAFYNKKASQKKTCCCCRARSLAIIFAIVTFVLMTTAASLVWGVQPQQDKQVLEPKGIWYSDQNWQEEWNIEHNLTTGVETANSTAAEAMERVERQPRESVPKEESLFEEAKEAVGIWFEDEGKANTEQEANEDGDGGGR